jgi:hypothetical protein
VFEGIFGTGLPVRIECGGTIGPKDAPATVVIGSPRVLQRAATAPRNERSHERAATGGRRDVAAKTYTRRDAIPIHRRGEAGASEIASPIPFYRWFQRA